MLTLILKKKKEINYGGKGEERREEREKEA